MSDTSTARNASTRKTTTVIEALTGAIKAEIGERKFEMWFGQTARIKVDGKALVIEAPSAYAAQWIGQHFQGVIDQCTTRLLGETLQVTIRAASNADSACKDPGREICDARSTSSCAEPALGRPVRARDSHEPTWRSFAEFIVGESNRLAFESARHIAETDDPGARLLCLHGSCGVGKTHLLQSICRSFRARRPLAKAHYTTGEQFTNEYIASIREGSIDALRRRFRRLDLLVIDDIHFLANKTATQSECLHTLDAIAFAGSKVVLATDAHPREIAKLSAPLVSRFLAGMVVRVEDPDRTTRRALAQTFASRRGLVLSEDAIDALIDRTAGNAREIDGSVMTVAALRAVEPCDGPCNRLSVERALGKRSLSGSGRPVRVAEIVAAVCEITGVEREDLVGPGRHRRVVTARGLAAHLARELTTLSYPEIAQALGRSTHSTVHAAAGRFREMVDKDEACAIAHAMISAADLAERTRRVVLTHRT